MSKSTNLEYQMQFKQKSSGFDPDKLLKIEPKKERGKRYNRGKVRYELIPEYPLYCLAMVYTLGAHKYSVYEDEKGNKILGKDIPFEDASKYKLIEDGANNWRYGLSWMDSIGSIERHLRSYKKGEDFDKELGTLHPANAAWGLFTLMEQHLTHPEMDDRLHSFLKPKKIGLDIDGVLADFTGHLMKVSGNEGHKANHWNDPVVRREFEKVKKDAEFWATIPPLINGKDVPFEVHCYITARSIDPEVTQAWLDKNHFPSAPLYCVGVGESKIEVAKKAGMDVFVDDSYTNFVELTNAGIFTYLYTAPYNEKYDVGHRRIKSLKELV